MKKMVRTSRYWEVSFDKTGRLLDDTGLEAQLAANPVNELFIFSHGWNSSQDGARKHYDFMFDQIAQMVPDESLGFVGVLWPSLLFPQDDPAPDGPVLGTADTQSASPLASAGPPPPQAVVSSGAEIAAALSTAFPGQEQDIDTLGELLDRRPQEPEQLASFVRLARGLVTTPNDAEEDRGEATVLVKSPRNVLDAMSALAPPSTSDAQAGFNPFGALWQGAKELLRTTSYYEMKNRAGVVGQNGLAPLVARIAGRPGAPRVHLMGHSFGARLVSFALAGLPDAMEGGGSPVKSLLLIQGAFSHFAFAPSAPVSAGKGALTAYGNRVDGPLLATFSSKDRAVGWWYPNASRLAWQDSQALVNPNFRWGGMGNDGYQQEAAQVLGLGAKGSAYHFETSRFYRLDANEVIQHGRSWFSGAHSDIDQPQLAWAAVSAAGLPR
jgi:hypothetical protein